MVSPLPKRSATIDLDTSTESRSAEELPTHGVIVVISTYRPTNGLADMVSDLARQVDHVVVVDDGSGQGADVVFACLPAAHVSVTRLASNRGIAAALNVGIEIARSRGARYVLTMDQDSRLAPNYVSRAIAAMTQLESAGKGVLAVGAGTINGNCIDPRDPRPFVPILDTLQSGLLFRLDAMLESGPFDERLFIDCVDTEYILRGASRGLHTYRARACALDHALGHSLQARLPGGRSVEFAYHTAWRRYYITRNRIEIVRRYGLRFPKWTMLQAYDQARYFGLTLLFGPQPGQQLLAFAVAVAHGMTSRLGPIPPGLKTLLSRSPTQERGTA